MTTLRFMRFENSRHCQRSVRKLYKEAFPVMERLPFFLLKSFAKNKVDFYGIYDRGEFIGMLYNVCYRDIVYIFYYAICEEYRGKGYGSKILQLVKSHYKNETLVLNIEEPDAASDNYEERLRRKHFYEKNGFYDLNYTIREAGVTYRMMGYDRKGRILQREEFLELMKFYFGRVIYWCFYRCFIQR